MYWRTLSAGLFLLLGGCAASTALTPQSDDHPASPTAPVTPPAVRSTMLAIDASAAPPTSVEPADRSAHVHRATSPTTQPGQAGYVCPMHPEVTSNKADDRCPKCKMKLKPATQKSAATTVPATSPAGHQHGGH